MRAFWSKKDIVILKREGFEKNKDGDDKNFEVYTKNTGNEFKYGTQYGIYRVDESGYAEGTKYIGYVDNKDADSYEENEWSNLAHFISDVRNDIKFSENDKNVELINLLGKIITIDGLNYKLEKV